MGMNDGFKLVIEIIIAILGTSGVVVFYLKHRIKIEEVHSSKFMDIKNKIDVQKSIRHNAEMCLLRLQARIIQGKATANGEYQSAFDKLIFEDEKLEALYREKAVIAQSIFKGS